MGLGRYFLHNLLDAGKLSTLDVEMDDRKSYEEFKGPRAKDPMTQLEFEVGYVSLVCRTLIEVMIAKKVCTKAELEDMMDKIDQMDGSRTGNFDPRNFGVG
jgi:hypothetical protein